ncbi:hypothetical protein E5C33_18680 [Stenotrophomonas maltophilia]|uniref:PDZ domain-containing protein n=1 Tax=Stenotrophomonas maltophilia TaxID=40324 RepID=UPI001075D190|nr:PDZ domain-containing protein [Stenotrophomonas maltophilia]TFZ43211.1 hypothetical protein E5C33_18680 [Stenotrophomonas maltophilia]
MRAQLLAMLLVLPLPVLAGGGSSKTLQWQQDAARLALHSTEGQVQVEAASPEARFGVRRGDRILRVDDTPVYQIEHLAQAMNQTHAARAYLLLRRERRLLSVAVDVDAWRRALAAPPPPPPPPAPPRH